MPQIAEAILFVASASNACIPAAGFVVKNRLPVQIIRLDTEAAREAAANGSKFQIKNVPSLVVTYTTGDTQLYIGGPKCEQVLMVIAKSMSRGPPSPREPEGEDYDDPFDDDYSRSNRSGAKSRAGHPGFGGLSHTVSRSERDPTPEEFQRLTPAQQRFHRGLRNVPDFDDERGDNRGDRGTRGGRSGGERRGVRMNVENPDDDEEEEQSSRERGGRGRGSSSGRSRSSRPVVVSEDDQSEHSEEDTRRPVAKKTSKKPPPKKQSKKVVSDDDVEVVFDAEDDEEDEPPPKPKKSKSKPPPKSKSKGGSKQKSQTVQSKRMNDIYSAASNQEAAFKQALGGYDQ